VAAAAEAVAVSAAEGGDEVRRQRTAKASRQLADLAAKLGAGAMGIERITRYGLHEDASLVIEVGNGHEIRFDRQADLFVPAIVMRRAALAGCDVPHLTAPRTLVIAKQVLDHAELVADDDARAQHRQVLRRFLTATEHAGTRITGDLSDKRVRYVRFCELRDHDPVDDGHTPPAALAIVLVDSDPDERHNGDRYVRVHDVGRFLRYELKVAVPWATLHSIAIEAGWRHPGELWQRQPGGRSRARINPYIAAAGWEVSDLPDSDSDSGENPPTS